MEKMAEEKKAKIGWVGCGRHASNLAKEIYDIPEFDLVAVCDLNEELARRNARKCGAGKWYTDISKMLSEEELDGAVVIGPPQMHCEVGKQCLDAGLPIFVEKPSAISYKEALDLAEYAEKKGLFGTIAYMKRHSTCYQIAKIIGEKEEFGKVGEIEVRFSNGPYPALWGIKEASKSFLIGQVVHIFNLIRFFGGEVDEVYARLNEVDENHFGFAITIAFKSGAVGVMNLNSLESPGDNAKVSEYLAVSGYECWIEIKDMVSLHYHPRCRHISEFYPAGRSQTTTWQPDWTELAGTEAFGYRNELQNFARVLLKQEKLKADLFDGAKDLQIIEAVWESSQTKKPVKIV